jgi:hypothetical protein
MQGTQGKETHPFDQAGQQKKTSEKHDYWLRKFTFKF